MEMRRVALAVSIGLLVAASEGSARNYFEDREYWYLLGERYTLRQFDGGNQITRDAGEAVGVGAFGDFLIADDTSLIGRLRGDAFLGQGNFDIATGPGTMASSTSTRYGLRTEGDLAWRVLISGGKVETLPFAGIGYRWRKSKVKNAASLQGFDETWHSIYARAGVRGGYPISRGISLFGEAGIKVPVYTRVTGGLSGGSGKAFKPGARVSGVLEAGMTYKGIRPSLYYEGSRFSRSGSSSGATYPETEGDEFGARIAFEF